MINKDFDVLKNWMFGSLSYLLDDIPHNPNLNMASLRRHGPVSNVACLFCVVPRAAGWAGRPIFKSEELRETANKGQGNKGRHVV